MPRPVMKIGDLPVTIAYAHHCDAHPHKPPANGHVELQRHPFNHQTSNSIAHPNGVDTPSSPPFRASDYANDGKHHLLIAASDSVATIKLPNIVQALSHQLDISIRIILTDAASNFLLRQSAEQPILDSLLTYKNVEAIYRDDDEWKDPWIRGAGISHIELRRWGDMLLIAPLSANSLAKITAGLSDNLLTSIVRAWDTTRDIRGSGNKRIMAMNTAMWRHPITKKQIRVLEEEWGVKGSAEATGWFEVLRPVEKELACGDVGDGAVREWNEIVNVVEERLELGSDTTS